MMRMAPVRCAKSIAIALLVAIGPTAHAATRVWIDTDPSLGAPYREVDDGFALVFGFNSPELQIAGISTTFGNAGVKRTTAVARDLVRRFGASAHLTAADVYAGAASPKSVDKATDATEALASAVREERLTYIALGPLTNLATFLQLHPELAQRIERVVFVGGRTPGRALTFGAHGGLQIHDANVFKDPEATRIVLRSPIPLMLAAPETGGRLVVTREDAKRLARGNSAAKFLQRSSRMWLWFWTGMAGNPGGPVFDSLGTLLVVRPELVRTETRYAAVRPSGELIASPRQFADGRRVLFATDVATDAMPFVLERLGAETASAAR